MSECDNSFAVFHGEFRKQWKVANQLSSSLDDVRQAGTRWRGGFVRVEVRIHFFSLDLRCHWGHDDHKIASEFAELLGPRETWENRSV
jgi:hypothetical protein